MPGHSSYDRKCKNTGIAVWAGLGKKQDTISKMNSEERAGDVAQVVKYLPSKYKALSSNLHTAKKKSIYASIFLWEAVENAALSIFHLIVILHRTPPTPPPCTLVSPVIISNPWVLCTLGNP
jgi:hypothetical protein